jgi:alpha-L-rhamnosidase
MILQSQLQKFMILLMLLTISGLAYAKTSLSGLKCEYLTNPLGLNVAHPRLTWQIESDETNIIQAAYEIRVMGSEVGLSKGAKTVWNSGKVITDQSVNIEYQGSPLESQTRYTWQVRIWDNHGKATPWSHPSYWETAFLDNALWKADWISAPEKSAEEHRPIYFRKEFACGKKVAAARLYISSHGLYQVFLNGEKVTSDLFTPGWTSYNKRTQYQTYDITKLLKAENAIGAIVGDGWYRGNIGGKVQRNYFGDKSALIAQLETTFSDGTSQVIATDGSWKTGNGPIIFSDIYNGETYDANLELTGWDHSGFSSTSFIPAIILNNPNNILITPVSYPVRAIEERIPQKMFTTPKGETVYDMGQNMVGWIRLKIKGKHNDHLILKFAEVLDKEGNFYTENLRKAKATDDYILRGGDEETLEPHFTFHGFRYVKLEYYSGTPDVKSITGVVIHSDMPQTGTFSCSDSLINRLQQNIQWGQRGNFLDIPTDCPQRDERLGWTGDAQVFSSTAAFNYDVAPFFTKWMADLAADQLPDGKVPDVVPDVRSGRGTSTAWGDAATVVPWSIYLAYGDTRILENQYGSMKAWVEYMHGRAGDDNLWTGDDQLGDWLAFASTDSDYPGATTEKDLIANAYYAWSTNLLAQTATILGKHQDGAKYSELVKNIKVAFVHEFVTPAGRLVSNTQTAYSLALCFGLLPDELISKAAGYLAEDVKKMEHLTTGFVGTPLLCKALSENGYADLAFTLLMNKEYPSWLYPVTQGATTIWERWDGQRPDGSFQDVTMNSFNHYAYGAIGQWLYTYVAGITIDPQIPGYKHFLLQPHPGGGLTTTSAELKTFYGTIISEWKLKNGLMTYSCSIPPNSSATINFDNSEIKEILMNNHPLLNSEVAKISENNQKVKIELGSGNYIFVLPYK